MLLLGNVPQVLDEREPHRSLKKDYPFASGVISEVSED